jgi:hypothetical protein
MAASTLWEHVWPAPRAVQDREYLNGSALMAIGDNVRRSRNHELASAVDPSDTALCGEHHESLDGLEDQIELPVRCVKAVFGDVAMQFESLRLGELCPGDLRGEAQTGLLRPFS